MKIIIITLNIFYLESDQAKVALGLSGIMIRSIGGSLTLGFNYGFGIFASRSFGAKNYEKYHLYFVQGSYNLIGTLAITILISLCSYQILLNVGQNQQMAEYTF